MIFLTINDAPSGVFQSQVIDVVKLIQESYAPKIRLVSFISIRGFRTNKKWIKQRMPNAVVLPMVPRLKNWRLNSLTLFIISFFVDTKIVIARNVMAAHLAFFNKKRGRSKSICYDGRGAFKAELEEYNVIPVAELIKSAGRLEAEAVNNSDYRIAVSEELVKYWEKEFDYLRGKEVVIPCTISTGLDETVNNDITLEEVMTMRRKLGWGQYDIVLIYSGSGAGWQSFDLLKKIFRHFLAADSRFKALFMSQEDQVITKLQEEFPGQVQRVWVAHEEVRSYLKSGDYGIMIREDSVTNRVSSPTKFAEYLSCGLRVLCSDSIGDYTNFVRKEECGVVVNESNYEGVVLVPITTGERNRIKKIGYHRFSKLSSEVMEKYGTLIEGLL